MQVDRVKWICVEVMLKANSSPEKADGEQALWIDGKPVGHWKNIRWRKSNDLSCVLRIASAGGVALLAGDIEATSELDLLIERREALAADLLLVPHHGSRTSSTRSFVAAVAPDHAVFSAGHRNRFGHPRADIVERYRDVDAAIHRTDHSGAQTFTFVPPGPGPPQAERERAARYWHARPEAAP